MEKRIPGSATPSHSTAWHIHSLPAFPTTSPSSPSFTPFRLNLLATLPLSTLPHSSMALIAGVGTQIQTATLSPPLTSATPPKLLLELGEGCVINQIKLGVIKNDVQVVAAVDDAGGVTLVEIEEEDGTLKAGRVWKTENGESTWGLAFDTLQDRLVVSSNAHALSLFDPSSWPDHPPPSDADTSDADDKVIEVENGIQMACWGHGHNVPAVHASTAFPNRVYSASIDGTWRSWNVDMEEVEEGEVGMGIPNELHPSANEGVDPNGNEDPFQNDEDWRWALASVPPEGVWRLDPTDPILCQNWYLPFLYRPWELLLLAAQFKAWETDESLQGGGSVDQIRLFGQVTVAKVDAHARRALRSGYDPVAASLIASGSRNINNYRHAWRDMDEAGVLETPGAYTGDLMVPHMIAVEDEGVAPRAGPILVVASRSKISIHAEEDGAELSSRPLVYLRGPEVPHVPHRIPFLHYVPSLRILVVASQSGIVAIGRLVQDRSDPTGTVVFRTDVLLPGPDHMASTISSGLAIAGLDVCTLDGRRGRRRGRRRHHGRRHILTILYENGHASVYELDISHKL